MRNASEWADANRVMPRGSPVPGPFRSSRNPYMVPVTAAYASTFYSRITVVMGTQMGKSVTLENVALQQLDDDPAPVLYVAPTKPLIVSVIEPKFMAAIRECASVKSKFDERRSTQTRKLIGGAPLRFAWAGSPTELSADSAYLTLVDEVDRIVNTKEGDTTEIIEARGDAYAGSKVGYTATPTHGRVSKSRHPVSGLEVWEVAPAEALGSTVWRLWQSGTRHEWAVRCPHCLEYFIPWSGLLRWSGCEDPDTDPTIAENTAFLACPNNGCVIENKHRLSMGQTGVAVAPGQTITSDGEVLGEAETVGNKHYSFFVSGLLSFSVKKTFGFLARKLAEARRTGDPAKLQATYNTGFGECYAMAGKAPPWRDVYAHRSSYSVGDDVEGISFVTLTVDVQEKRLVYVVRGWRAGMSSALLDYGSLWGDTDAKNLEPGEVDVWDQLEALMSETFSGRRPDLVGIDAGFRQPTVLDFVRRHRRVCVALKGRSPMVRIYQLSYLDSNKRGKTLKSDDHLWFVDSDGSKSWVHSRIGRDPKRPGAWLLPADIEEGYCREIVAEEFDVASRKWKQVHRDNHFLDCEAMAYVLARMLRVHKLKVPVQQPPSQDASEGADPVDASAVEGSPEGGVPEDMASLVKRLAPSQSGNRKTKVKRKKRAPRKKGARRKDEGVPSWLK